MKPLSQFGSDRRDAALEAQAADWVARRDGGLSEAEARELAQWLAADQRHAETFAHLEATWATLNAPRLAGRGEQLLRQETLLEQRQWRRRHQRQALWAATGLVAAAALAVIFRPAPLFPTAAPAPASPTVVFRPDRQVLADGSTIELAAGAKVSVEFSAAQRTVRLVQGRALFRVTRDPARPFVVSVGGIAVRAVGTEFAVRLNTDEVAVLVTEGRVAVTTATSAANESAAPPPNGAASDAPAAALVEAGNMLVLPTAGVGAAAPTPRPLERAAIAQELAWRHHRVEFAATTLAEAVALMNRRNDRQLVLGDATTAGLRITGVFWTDDPAGFARLLETSLGVRSTPAADGSIVLSQ